MAAFALIGVGRGKRRDGGVESVAFAKISANRCCLAGARMRPRQRPSELCEWLAQMNAFLIEAKPKRTRVRLKSLLYLVWLTPDSFPNPRATFGARVPSAA